MSRNPTQLAIALLPAATLVLAIAATMSAASLARGQDTAPEALADFSVEPHSATKNVPEPSAVVIAATAAAMEGWSIWKRRRRTAHANLIGTGAAGGRSSG